MSFQKLTTASPENVYVIKQNIEEWEKDIIIDMLLPKLFHLDDTLMRIKGDCQFCGHDVLVSVHRPALNGKLVQGFGCVKCRKRYVIGYMYRVFPGW
jgi:hypothetical protein